MFNRRKILFKLITSDCPISQNIQVCVIICKRRRKKLLKFARFFIQYVRFPANASIMIFFTDLHLTVSRWKMIFGSLEKFICDAENLKNNLEWDILTLIFIKKFLDQKLYLLFRILLVKIPEKSLLCSQNEWSEIQI